jgi:hypothetical protein
MFQINVAAAEEEDSSREEFYSSTVPERSSTVLQRGVLQFYSSTVPGSRGQQVPVPAAA